MFDAEVKHATCRVKCGKDVGTGWLVSPNKIMTASHCVADAIEEDENIKITVSFNSLEIPKEFTASIIDHDSELDICLLSIKKPIDIAPITINDSLPIEGSQFYSHGWPVNKLTVGHRLEGTISQVLNSPELIMDIDLHVDTSAALSNYQGFSGAALICDRACLGIIRVAIDNTVGAISAASMRDFLERHEVLANNASIEKPITQSVAPRNKFTQKLESVIIDQSGGYIFIEGAHGIGKSTFCGTYASVDSSLEHFDTYSLTSKKETISVTQRAQPQEFCDWLNIKVSTFLTQQAERTIKKDYSSLIKETDFFLTRLGEAYVARGKTGVLFIDGIDEIEKISEELLVKFIGLLPSKPPTGLAIVLSAPNYAKLAAQLGERLGDNACLSLPPLENDIERQFCRQALTITHSIGLIINVICDRARGHPLYLRYLIDLANSGVSVDELEALPLINGHIRNYYEALWNQLKADSEAVNLLAIIARLRWGISIEQFSKILNQTELAVLVSTIDRIRHLLLTPSKTAIYHSSFSDFLLDKTHLRELDIQNRLAEYCKENNDNHYGLLNIIYHGLKSENIEYSQVISICDQNWVDKCVTQGVEPDILLGDVDKVLASATKIGSLTETIRILLLSNRLQFRYNTLFAQSAELMADALISLKKNQEVLAHVIRYDRLIVTPLEALKVTLKLIEANDFMAAQKLLKSINKELDNSFSSHDKGMNIHEFLGHYDLQLQQRIFKLVIGDQSAPHELQKFQYAWMESVRACIPDEAENKLIRSEMMCYTQAAMMCLTGRYLSVKQMRQFYTGPDADFLEPLIYSISYYKSLCDDYRITPSPEVLELAFADLQNLIVTYRNESEKIPPHTIDALTSLGVPSNIIRTVSGQSTRKQLSVQFVARDNVSFDEDLLQKGMAAWRFESLIDATLPCPTIVPLSPSDWKNGIESICRVVAWCDGAARRAAELNDSKKLNNIWSTLRQKVFAQLEFTLAQRVEWKDSYALPEAVFPNIYQKLTTLINDIFPHQSSNLLAFIEKQFTSQCGLYSEGFRDILSIVLDKVTSRPLDFDVEDQAFSLLQNWRDFVLSNLKNRHELVPELLTIVPLFVRLNAPEEAQRTYQSVLAFSMGPSWYKENQLGLMVSALESVGHDTSLESGVLSQIAGFLDAAAGEMTFQRFVRYAKRDFIGALCKRGDYAGAVNYFTRQTYGSSKQLLQEATAGEMDRISPLRGSRFPGGALDEQDAIWSILLSAIPVTDWPLCWTLLEIFQFGDSRHLDNYAESYARLMQQTKEDSDALALMLERLELIYESEVEKEQRSNFLSSVAKSLPPELLEKFEQRFGTTSNNSTTPKLKSNQLSADSCYQEKPKHIQERESNNEVRMAGVWGARGALQDAKEALSKAERHLRRHNMSEAQKEALAALKNIQTGGWSIWVNSGAEVSKAKKILLQATDSISDVVKLYSTLILNERYAERWLMADNIIEWIGGNVNQDEQAILVRLTVEHIKLMVGATSDQIQGYEFLDKLKEVGASSCLMQLILHAIDHPTWLRSEKAADMLLWLLRSHSEYIPIVGPKAFSMDSNNHPDVLCGILDQLSSSNSKHLWDQLAPALTFENIKHDCKHVGRLSVLMRIANRAAKNGSGSAINALALLQENIPTSAEEADASLKNEVECPSWAEVIETQWFKLKEQGLANRGVIERALVEIKTLCSPLSLETSIELEQLLAEGFKGSSSRPWRWEAKVRFAFQVALLPITTESLFPQIEKIFRPYNPSPLDQLRVIGFSSPAIGWLNQLENSMSPITPVCGRHIYLDFYERVWVGRKWKSFRLTAYFSDYKEDLPLPSGRFFSTEEPTQKNTTLWDTCDNVLEIAAFFGSFTPALPTSTLMQITRADSSDLSRAYWRSGRVTESLGGGPEHEGCYLTIERDALALPFGFKLVWVVEVDEKPIKMITTN